MQTYIHRMTGQETGQQFYWVQSWTLSDIVGGASLNSRFFFLINGISWHLKNKLKFLCCVCSCVCVCVHGFLRGFKREIKSDWKSVHVLNSVSGVKAAMWSWEIKAVLRTRSVKTCTAQYPIQVHSHYSAIQVCVCMCLCLHMCARVCVCMTASMTGTP